MSISSSIPNTPKPVAPETFDAAHPAPNAEGSNATQHEPDPVPAQHPDAPIDGTYIKPSPYTAGNV